MRTPSMMNATTAAMKKTQTAYLTVPVANHVAADSTSAMISLINIRYPLLENPLARVLLRDVERVALRREHVDDRSRFRRIAARHARIPRRAAITDARQARALVDPVLEIRRLTGIDLLHLLCRAIDAIDVDPVRAGCGDQPRNDRLDREVVSEVGGGASSECCHAEHQEIERASDQLGDHEDQTED